MLNFGQHNADLGAPSKIAFNTDLALVTFNDTFNNGEPQTAALVFGGKEWVKYLFGIFSGYPLAGVLKDDFNPLALMARLPSSRLVRRPWAWPGWR